MPADALGVASLLGLLTAALLVAIVVRYLNLPYTVALVVVGVALGLAHAPFTLDLTSETILHVFLPALLFQAAINLRLDVLRQTALPILLLAVVGVLISVALIAAVFSAVLGVAGAAALVFAATVSATDPVAVLAVFKKLGVPERLEMMVEGESLFNDGTSLVIFQIGLLAAENQHVGALGAAVTFVITVLGGALLGAFAGAAMTHVMRLTGDHLVETGLSTVLAYGSYLVGERLGVSPVITVVIAGLTLANYGREIGLSPRARGVVVDVWEYVAFVMNSLLFLLIGIEVRLTSLPAFGAAILLAILLVLVSRAIVVYGLSGLLAFSHHKLPWQWQHLAFWGGLRGALTVAMALSLPSGLPNRDLLIAASFAVVLFTILGQGTTIDWMVRRLDLRRHDRHPT